MRDQKTWSVVDDILLTKQQLRQEWTFRIFGAVSTFFFVMACGATVMSLIVLALTYYQDWIDGSILEACFSLSALLAGIGWFSLFFQNRKEPKERKWGAFWGGLVLFSLVPISHVLTFGVLFLLDNIF